MTGPLLDVVDLRAFYGPLEALHGISFQVATGEAVVILGANGAGKTSTLRALSRTIAVTGSIRFDGDEIAAAKPHDVARSGIAHVPQGRGTFADLSVADNLRAGAYGRRDSDVAADIDYWYEMYPVLRQRRGTAAGSLSGGEQQMLAVARAMLSRPRLLLLDEPSLGLAPLIVRELFETFRRVSADTGLAMLIVEQNAALALEIAQRGYVLESGVVVTEATSADLRDDPAIQRAYLGRTSRRRPDVPQPDVARPDVEVAR